MKRQEETEKVKTNRVRLEQVMTLEEITEDYNDKYSIELEGDADPFRMNEILTDCINSISVYSENQKAYLEHLENMEEEIFSIISNAENNIHSVVLDFDEIRDSHKELFEYYKQRPYNWTDFEEYEID